MYDYRAREYDSQTGRFIQQDPLGLNGGGINLYAYVMNQPLRYRDPMGTGLNIGGFVSCVGHVVIMSVGEEIALEQILTSLLAPEAIPVEVAVVLNLVGTQQDYNEIMNCAKNNSPPPRRMCPYHPTQIVQGGPVIGPPREPVIVSTPQPVIVQGAP